MVGYVGVPNGGAELPIRTLFDQNIGVNGGVAPVRNYIHELLPEVLSGASTRAASSTSNCLSLRRPRPTPRWTSAGRQRCCFVPEPGVICMVSLRNLHASE